MTKGILLEAGTNEMEMLEFRLGQTRFGINVAKVREITQRIKTVSIPYSPPAVEGSFQLRDSVLSLINLGKYFDMQGQETLDGDGAIIITEFNDIHCGILVDAVEQIHRLSWSQIEQPSSFLINLDAPITGTVNIGEKTILIVDCETVISDILGINCANNFDPEAHQGEEVDEKDISIIFADDSNLVRKTIVKVLNSNGYKNITVCSDGAQAWEKIEQAMNNNQKQFDLVLSDIEMPGMDGLHLTAKIKQNETLKDIPVILFSSLITEDNRKKGESVGADAQISKPDSESIISTIKTCMEKVKTLATA